MEKTFQMFSVFNTYGGWQMQVISLCQKFYEKYDRWPNFIRMNDATLDALIDEDEKAFNNPDSEEHAVRDSNGNKLIPLQRQDDGKFLSFDEKTKMSDLEVDEYVAGDDAENDTEDEVIYPMSFGVNDDCTVSFFTNKFELQFLEGTDLPEGYFIVMFGEPGDDGGEDFDEDISDGEEYKLFYIAA